MLVVNNKNMNGSSYESFKSSMLLVNKDLVVRPDGSIYHIITGDEKGFFIQDSYEEIFLFDNKQEYEQVYFLLKHNYTNSVKCDELYKEFKSIYNNSKKVNAQLGSLFLEHREIFNALTNSK